MIRIEKTKLQQLFVELDGKIATAVFYKADGSRRTINFRLGVSKGVKGTGRGIARYSNPYVTVYDMKAQGYRNVNLNTIVRVNANGEQYWVGASD